MKLIDLSLQLENGLVTFPGNPKAIVLEHESHQSNSSKYRLPCQGVASFQLILNDHTGTHIDAPFHMCPNKDSLELLQLKKLVGEAVLLDFSYLNENKEITESELEKYVTERKIIINKGDIVLIKKWSGKWGENNFFKCQALNESAAFWLIDKKISAIGIDLSTVEVEESPGRRAVHIQLLSRDIYIIENLVDLDLLKSHSRFVFVALPLKIKGITGSPTRAIAIIEDKK